MRAAAQSLRKAFEGRALYSGWLALSTALLLCSWAYDPYIFGALSLGSCWVSALVMLTSLIRCPRLFLFAVLAAVPSALSLAALSTFNWA